MPDEAAADQADLIYGPDPNMAEQKVYFNGFAISITPADVIITLQMQGKPIVSLHTSHGVGKTLYVKLAGVIQTAEALAGQPFVTTDEMMTALLKSQAQHGSTENEQQ